MAERTRFLARLIGLYCLLAALMMFVQRAAMIAAVNALLHDPPLLVVLGLFLVAAGLALVLGHNVWSGGALPMLVTVIGWLTLLKGMLFWLLPPAGVADFYIEWLHYADLYYLYCVLALVVGVYFTAAGFSRGARPS